MTTPLPFGLAEAEIAALVAEIGRTFDRMTPETWAAWDTVALADRALAPGLHVYAASGMNEGIPEENIPPRRVVAFRVYDQRTPPMVAAFHAEPFEPWRDAGYRTFGVRGALWSCERTLAEHRGAALGP